MTKNTPTPTSRGPHDHGVRNQILDAAMAHSSHYGCEKATVTDLARATGSSKAYIYKFFDSKQAIGEAICVSRLEEIMAAVSVTIADAPSTSEKLRCLFRALTEAGSEPLLEGRKLYDIAAVAACDKWPLMGQYTGHLQQLIDQALAEGRQAGELERRTPLDEVTLAVYMVMCLFINPVQLQYNFDTVLTTAVLPASLILRGLSP